MEEIRYTPKAAHKYLAPVLVILLILSICGFVLSSNLPAYRGAVQAVALVLTVVSLYLLYKYCLTSYAYIILPPVGEEPPMLLIEQHIGRRTTLLNRMPLTRIFEVREIANGQSAGVAVSFSYLATFAAGEYQLLRTRCDDGREMYVKIEADASFLAALRTCIASARARAAEDPDC